MTTYNVNSGYGLTFRVDYVDPAGGFGGWFLHTLNDIGFSPITNGTDAATMATEMSGSPPANAQQATLHASIKARFALLFGTDASVSWTVTLLQGITPAVLDDSY